MNFYLDFEATRFSNRIISIGCSTDSGATFSTLVQPVHKAKVDKFITELTGITNEMLAEAPSADIAFNMLADFIELNNNDGKPHLYGFNSDVIGFTNSIEKLVKDKHSKALILGTGGASKAIAYSLKQLGIEFLFVSRNAGDNKIAYSDLTKEIMERHTLIVNCTPLGMVGHGIDQCPDIPYEYIGEKHLLYDIVYNPENTMFLQKGAERGATTKSGYEMWYLQALASWDIWNK